MINVLGSENVVEKQIGRVVKRMEARLKSLETNRVVVTEEIDELNQQQEALKTERNGLDADAKTLKISIKSMKDAKGVVSEAL